MRWIATGVMLLSPAAPAFAQQGPVAELSVLSDYRERGLSWSEGKAAGQAVADLPIGDGFGASLQATTLRRSARQGGADSGFRISGDYRGARGVLNWRTGIVGHFFAGGSGPLDYIEFDLGAGAALGPVEVDVLASYAPSQAAIGGDNLYGRARARLAIIGTPMTARAHFGHSTGSIDAVARSQRLRPGGDYNDWSVGVDYAIRHLVLSLTYSDTDVNRSAVSDPAFVRHADSRLVVGAHLSL